MSAKADRDPAEKIQATVGGTQTLIPRRLHQDSTHTHTNETKRFPDWVGEAPSPNLRSYTVHICSRVPAGMLPTLGSDDPNLKLRST